MYNEKKFKMGKQVITEKDLESDNDDEEDVEE